MIQAAVDYRILSEQQAEQIGELLYKIGSLTHQLGQLKKAIYGSRQERFIPTQNPSQLSLNIQADPIAQCSIGEAKKIEYIRSSTTIIENKKEHPGRMKLPEHLERREIIIKPLEDVEGLKK